MSGELPPGVEQDIEELGGIEILRRMRPDPSVITRLERLYDLLSCRNRVMILFYLNLAPLTPGVLSELTGLRPNLLTFHLKRMEGSGVVSVERDGRYRIYSLTDLGTTLMGTLGR